MSLGLHPHDALAHLDLVAEIGGKVAHDARVRGEERVLHLHRLHHREAYARLDRLALLNRERDEPTVHRRADRRVPVVRVATGLGERIDKLNERLPPSGEGVNAAVGLVEGDLAVPGRPRSGPRSRPR